MTAKTRKMIEQFQNGEVPKGYKCGKLGIVPKEWEEVTFSSLFTSSSDYTDDLNTYPLYSLTIEDGITAKTERYDRAHLVKKENSYKIVRPNDYAYNPMNIRFGAVARHKGDMPVAVSGYYDIFTTVHQSDLPFMDNFLTCGAMITYYNKVSTGSLVEKQRVHFSDFLKFSLPLPPLAERERIAKILSAQDKVIECYEKKIEQLKLMKKYYLQNMFPKRGETVPKIRFKGFNDAWEQRKLGEISKRVFGNDGRMELPTLTISAANGWMNQVDRFSENKAGQEQTNYTLLHKGELSYNHGNSKIAKYGTVFSLESYEEALVPRVYHSFRMIEKHSASFIEYCFATKNLDRELSKLITSGARMDGLLNISFDEFMGINLLLSCTEEQERIANFFRAFDHLIAINQRKFEEEKKKKKALQQLLLTGIVRTN